MNLADSTKEELNTLQTKLVRAAASIENEMSNVTKSLEYGHKEVSTLEQKVKELEKELTKTKKESSIDYLTGLYTRRAYDNEVQRVEAEYARDGQDYALVFFDLDHFKDVNDTYGHDCGDVVLKTFAQILLKLTRKSDIIGRYGGEEFIAIIKYTSKSELVQYLTRIKKIVTTNKFKYKNLKLDITFSAGVNLRSKHSNYEDTIQQTDTLLYQAKNEGRNRIIFTSGTVI